MFPLDTHKNMIEVDDHIFKYKSTIIGLLKWFQWYIDTRR